MGKYDRRDFIKQSTLLTTGVLSAPLIACGPSVNETAAKIIQPDKKLGVALVGLGYYSTSELAPALQLTEHCALKGIVTGSPEKIPIWQEKYGISDSNIYNYDNMHEIADNDEIDVVYIVVPTGLHMKYAVIAAEAGKHVWCEKPMALDVPQCERIIKACDQNKVKLSIGYRVQHEPNMQEIIRLTKEKVFGDVTAIHAAAGYSGGTGSSWRFRKELGGGALYDMGVYTINAIRHASQMEAVAVISAQHSTNRPDTFFEVDETTEYVLDLGDGVTASGKTSVGESVNILQVSCTNGSYMLSPMQSYNGIKGERSDGVKIFTPIENQQALQMDHDAIAIKNDQHVLVPGIDGLRDIAVVNAIQRSAQIGERVEVNVG